jgi:hypothetical protein
MSTHLDTPSLTLVTAIARLGMRATRSHESGLAGVNSTSTGELDRGSSTEGLYISRKSQVGKSKEEVRDVEGWKSGDRDIDRKESAAHRACRFEALQTRGLRLPQEPEWLTNS